MNNKLKSTLALFLCLVMAAGSLASCKGDADSKAGGLNKDPSKQVTYNSYTSVMPSNWNALTYQDNNDTQIMTYISSSFFEYDYKFEDDKKFNEDGTINKEGVVPGAYTTNYSAATKLEDVTSSVDAKWGYTAEQKKEGGYAWKITFRDDLKWDDGTPITAADFEYSMQQTLDPDFMNFRANEYYDTLKIKGSRNYFFQNQKGTYETVESQGYASNQAALDAGQVFYINVYDFYGAEGYTDANGNACPEWVSMSDETVWDTANAWTTGTAEDAFSGKDLWDAYFTPETGAYAGYVEIGGGYESWISLYVENTISDVKWEDVGCYAIEEENAIVICLDKTYAFLTEDGGLSVWAPYYMSSLPLVHKEKYEAAKIAPTAGATLWTSKYNSSLETSASWGPYKLAEFEAGSHYRLVKNENWYGWNMDMFQNQYNIDAIYCRKVEEFATQWMGFLSGQFDEASLQTENVAEYADSKYVSYSSTGTGTFGMQLFSDLSVLKNSDNNNGILAIREFRHALNLGLNRNDIVSKIWPGSAVPCFGLLNVAYYYDIENSPTLADGGQYRNTTLAKEGILRAYGFTETNGKWSSGELKNLDLDEAYDALTGYNPVEAKNEMNKAIEILTANAEEYGYDPSKNITLVYGSSVDNDKQRFRADYLQEVIDDLTAGTALEDKIDVKFDASAGSEWANAFRSGATQIGFGYGFSGNPFNPFNIVGAFVDPEDTLNYHQYWDTSAIDMTLKMPAGDYDGAGEEITMSVQNWYFCLNGRAASEKQPKTYNWDAGYAPAEARLTILSALEELTIQESRSVMLIAESGGSFLSAKFSQFSEEEHTFMAFGGIQYMEVNYNDEEWAAYVAANNNDLTAEYKKSE